MKRYLEISGAGIEVPHEDDLSVYRVLSDVGVQVYEGISICLIVDSKGRRGGQKITNCNINVTQGGDSNSSLNPHESNVLICCDYGDSVPNSISD